MLNPVGADGVRRNVKTEWKDLYRQLKESGRILDGNGKAKQSCRKSDGFVGIEFDITEGTDVRLSNPSRKFVPANGVEGTAIFEPGEESGKRVFFYNIKAPYIPEGAEAQLDFEMMDHGEKVDERKLTIAIQK